MDLGLLKAYIGCQMCADFECLRHILKLKSFNFVSFGLG